MTAHVFEPAKFRALFQEFAIDPSDVALGVYWGVASNYIASSDGVILPGDALDYALNLMTAHIAKLQAIAAAGNTPGVVSSATEGSVSVSFQPPPVKSALQFWLAQTPYGAQLWALLSVKSAGGLHIGGSLERASFRKAAGVF